VDVDNVKDGLDKVESGKLFGFIDTLATTGYYIQKDYIGQLKIAGKFDETWDLGIGTRNDEPLLKDIFDKAIEQVGAEKKQEILNKWVSVNYDKGVNYDLVLKWVAIVSIVFAIILAVFIYANRKLRIEIKRRKSVEKKLEQMSVTDALTSLYNRRHFNEIFPRMINSAKREDENICFAILDIDYFKQYNDFYGHIAGDDVLKKIAGVISTSLHRADDYCFRLGGEEFGILFKGLSVDEAKLIIEKMRQNIETLHIEHKKSVVSNYVSASFGLIVKNANEIKIYEDLYREADKLLYKAKADGRNMMVSNV
jgi:polar amino acid transport system substrate-binding protein